MVPSTTNQSYANGFPVPLRSARRSAPGPFNLFMLKASKTSITPPHGPNTKTTQMPDGSHTSTCPAGPSAGHRKSPMSARKDSTTFLTMMQKLKLSASAPRRCRAGIGSRFQETFLIGPARHLLLPTRRYGSKSTAGNAGRQSIHMGADLQGSQLQRR
jgi:hypothetical protein